MYKYLYKNGNGYHPTRKEYLTCGLYTIIIIQTLIVAHLDNFVHIKFHDKHTF